MNLQIETLRTPLFTFLSGLVYRLRHFNGNSQAFLVDMARRLLPGKSHKPKVPRAKAPAAAAG